MTDDVVQSLINKERVRYLKMGYEIAKEWIEVYPPNIDMDWSFVEAQIKKEIKKLGVKDKNEEI